MKSIGYFLIIIILISSIQVFAQHKDSNFTSLKKGQFGIFLNVSSDFSSNNFIGGTFGVKYFISNHFSVRTGLSINKGNFRLSDSSAEQSSENEQTSENMSGNNSNLSTTTFGTQAYLSYYPIDKGIIKFYIGAGGILNFLTTPKQFTVNGTVINNESSKTSLGIGGLLGSEYKVLKNLTISLEYNPTFIFDKNKNENNTMGTGLPEYKGQREVNLVNANLGITYFFK